MSRTAAFLSVALVFSAWGALLADDVAQFLPRQTFAYLEWKKPAATVEELFNPRVRQLLQETPKIRQFLRSKEYAQLRVALTYVETRLETPWADILRKLSARGVHVALVPEADLKLCVIFHADSPATVQKVVDVLVELIQEEGNVRTARRNGITVRYVGNDFGFFSVGPFLVLSNSQGVLNSVLNQHLRQGGGTSLAADADFRDARQRLRQLPERAAADGMGSADLHAWAFVRLEPLRNETGLRDLTADQFDDGGAPLVLGTVPHVLKESPYLVASLWKTERGFSLVAELPRSDGQWPEHWQWAHAEEAGQEAAVPLRPEGTILSFSIYRDLAGFWAAKDRLVTKEGLAGFVELENELGKLLFGNRDFATEVLAELDPRVRVVVVEPTYDKPDAPAIKLPGFAYVQRVRHPEDFGRDLLIAYQTLIGLSNVGLAQANRPRLLTQTTSYRDVELTVAQFQEPAADVDDPQWELLRNFAPTFALCDGYAIIGSNREVVERVIDLLKDDPQARAATPHNVILELYAEPLARLIEVNREVLVHQQITEEGVDPAEAERRIDTLLQVVRLFSGARAVLGADEAAMYLRLDINWAVTPPRATGQ